MHYQYHPSPIGRLLLAADEDGLRLLHMDEAQVFTLPEDWRPARFELDAVRMQLDEYFAGKRKQFALRLAPQGTGFQLKVWQGLQTIGYGQTCSYGELATAIGQPTAVRALGAANGANPIAVIIPCHRVIGRNGSLTGFSGGIERKAWLLALESRQQPMAF